MHVSQRLALPSEFTANSPQAEPMQPGERQIHNPTEPPEDRPTAPGPKLEIRQDRGSVVGGVFEALVSVVTLPPNYAYEGLLSDRPPQSAFSHP